MSYAGVLGKNKLEVLSSFNSLVSPCISRRHSYNKLIIVYFIAHRVIFEQKLGPLLLLFTHERGNTLFDDGKMDGRPE